MKDLMKAFEEHMDEKDMMEDAAKNLLPLMTNAEIAACIREGHITVETVEETLRKEWK